MDYKAIVAENPHVLKYLKKTIQMPAIQTDINKSVESVTKEVKYGVVVAIKVDGKVRTGWSVCSHLDNFSRNKGRAIAILRAISGKSDIAKVPTRNFPDSIKTDAFEAESELESLAQEIL